MQPRGSTATDLVLDTSQQLLRAHGVVGKFVEFLRRPASRRRLSARRPRDHRQHGARSTARRWAFFPVDDRVGEATCALTGRDRANRSTSSSATPRSRGCSACRRQRTPSSLRADLELDLATIEPSVAGPKRPQDRVNAARRRLRRMPSAALLVSRHVQEGGWLRQSGCSELGSSGSVNLGPSTRVETKRSFRNRSRGAAAIERRPGTRSTRVDESFPASDPVGTQDPAAVEELRESHEKERVRPRDPYGPECRRRSASRRAS